MTYGAPGAANHEIAAGPIIKRLDQPMCQLQPPAPLNGFGANTSRAIVIVSYVDAGNPMRSVSL